MISSQYERRVARRIPRTLKRYAGMRNAKLVYAIAIPDNPHIPELLEEATADGSVTDEQADYLIKSDLIVLGETDEGIPQYAVAEISVTIDRHDIDRAVARAATLQAASSVATIAVVIGEDIPDANRQQAAENNVTVIIIPE